MTNFYASDRISNVESLHRLGDQDAALSRLKPEFESLWRHYIQKTPSLGVFYFNFHILMLENSESEIVLKIQKGQVPEPYWPFHLWNREGHFPATRSQALIKFLQRNCPAHQRVMIG